MKNPFSASSARSGARTTKPGETLNLADAASTPAWTLSSDSVEPDAPSHTSGRTRRRTWPIIAGGLALALVAGGSAVYATAHKTITLDVDGNVQTVSTFAGSVEGLLSERGITVGADDVVAPSKNAELSDDADVVVRYAREITLQQDGVATTITTTAVDADELLAAYAGRADEVSLVASRSAGDGRVDLGLRLSLEGPVQLKVDGAVTEVPSGATDVSEVLTDQGVELGELDRVSVQHVPTAEALVAQQQLADREAAQAAAAAPAADAAALEVDPAAFAADAADPAAPAEDPAAAEPSTEATPDVITDPRLDDTELAIVVNRVTVAEQTVDAAIPFETVTEDDSTRYKDLAAKTKVEGVEGQQSTVFSVTTVDGVEESRTLVSDTVALAPVTKVVAQGTKERPKVVTPKAAAPAATATTTEGAAAAAPAPVVATGDVWGKLAQCESGGNASIISSNGLYHGLYQFTVGTWQSLGGTGLPSQASAAEQTRLAQALQARSGWGQWPACSSKLGLR
ncbi:resuscitation-promoting factor [Sanguibacter gelidistatuariae]|uniref:resuscitation-promoting factor n=1 Tax=Sanguibacter gelidistatuariae TaxID=1814289 RepID=UPI0015881D61|nr:resuscitation-promoting factor [Sanguibacter gelidistatuariae]